MSTNDVYINKKRFAESRAAGMKSQKLPFKFNLTFISCFVVIFNLNFLDQ